MSPELPAAGPTRERPSARLLILDPDRRVLLFHFRHHDAPAFWATPGGALDPGESFADAARRELREETGLQRADVGPEVHRREAVFDLPDGARVRADERFFLIEVEALDLDSAGWTELEQQVMVDHRWWSIDDLRATAEQVWPEDLADILRRCVAPLDEGDATSACRPR